MARRTGIPSLIKYLHKILQLLADFLALIVSLYPEETELQAEGIALQQAAQTFYSHLVEIRDYGD